MDNRQTWQPEQQHRRPSGESQFPDDTGQDRKRENESLFGDDDDDEFDPESGQRQPPQSPGIPAEEGSRQQQQGNAPARENQPGQNNQNIAPEQRQQR